MSEARGVTPSPVELLVLGCLSQKQVPGDDVLGHAVRELWLRENSLDEARSAATAALGMLRHRGLVSDRKLTATGSQVLCNACGVSRKPAWNTFRQRYFPAIALGVAPAPVTRRGPDALAQRLARKLGVAEPPTMIALCDSLIARELRMPPGKLTLARIRAHVLAQCVQAEAKGGSGDVRSDMQHTAITHGPPAAEPRPDVRAHGPSSPPLEPLVPIAAVDDRSPDLLAFVRETLTEIGDEGRFGQEKVFVSALWHELAHRGPPARLSLDHFKQWLVAANRNRWLTLARADVVGAMDPTKVRESEIQDRGATFHFVLDPARNPAVQQGRPHVR